MVLVRAGPEANANVRALSAAGAGLQVGTRRFAVLPYTHGRGPSAAAGRAGTDSDVLHAAARSGCGRPAGATSFGLVVERCPADAGGCPIPGAAPRAACLRRGHGHEAWAEAQAWAHPECFEHGYLHTRVEAWTAEAGGLAGVEPGDQAPTLHHNAGARALQGPLLVGAPGGGALLQARCGAGVTNWRDCLPPGAVLVTSIEVGGRVTLAGPGEVDVMVMTRPGWVRVGTPAATGARAAASGHGADISIALEGAVAGPWLLYARAPAVPVAAPAGAGNGPTGVPWAADPQDAAGPPKPSDLRSWLTRRLRDHGTTAPLGDGPWSVAAWAALEDFGLDVGRSATVALAAWLHEHVTAHMSGPRRPTTWQWDLTILGKLMEAAGIAELAGDDPGLAAALTAEAGFAARALRQLPLRDWVVGRRGFVPGVAIPGMLARDQGAWGRTRFPLGDRARDALDAAVQGTFPAPARDAEMADSTAVERDPPMAPPPAAPPPATPPPATPAVGHDHGHDSHAGMGPARDRAAHEDGAPVTA